MSGGSGGSAGILGDSVEAPRCAQEKGLRPTGISAEPVRQSDGELSQRPPEPAFTVRSALPSRLEQLVGFERASRIEQELRPGQQSIRIAGADERGHGGVVGDPLRAAGQRAAQLIAGSSVTRSTLWVTVTRARPGHGPPCSASQPSTTALKTSGAS